MECPTRLVQLQFGLTDVQAQYVHKTSLSAVAAGIPTRQTAGVCVVVVRRRGDEEVASKLTRWKKIFDGRKPTAPTLGEFLRRYSSFFLKRRQNNKGVFSFDGKALTLTQNTCHGTKASSESLHDPSRGRWTAERGTRVEVGGIRKITMRSCVYHERCGDEMQLYLALEEVTLPPMLREVQTPWAYKENQAVLGRQGRGRR